MSHHLLNYKERRIPAEKYTTPILQIQICALLGYDEHYIE